MKKRFLDNVKDYNSRIVKQYSIIYKVESFTHQGLFYNLVVREGEITSCDCPHYINRHPLVCKHMYVLQRALQNHSFIDESTKKEKLVTVFAS